MFFILAENPDIPVRKAMRMSILMTNGHKADLFKLDMSFIGWTILSLLTGGLVELWVGPYRAMAKVNAFHALKEEALRVGVLERYDFGEDEANSVEENNSAENNPPAEKAVQVQEEKAVTQEPAAFIKEDTQIEYDVLDESDNPENIGEDK